MTEQEYQEYARKRQIQLEHDWGMHRDYPHADCVQCNRSK